MVGDTTAGAKLPEHKCVELATVVEYPWDAEPAENVLYHEIFYLLFSNGSQLFSFCPLGEVVHGDDGEPDLPLCYGERSYQINSPLNERPWADDRGLKHSWSVGHAGEFLTLVTTLYVLLRIPSHGWPVVPLQ